MANNCPLGNYLQSSSNPFQLLWLLVTQNNWQITSKKAKIIIIKLRQFTVLVLS